jgi:hypothetical protein
MDPRRVHPVPRLDTPDRIGPLPMRQTLWTGLGLAFGPLFGLAVAWWLAMDPVRVWDQWWAVAAWVVVFVACVGFAFVRPGGLDARQWAVVVLDYVLRPKRTCWR